MEMLNDSISEEGKAKWNKSSVSIKCTQFSYKLTKGKKKLKNCQKP